MSQATAKEQLPKFSIIVPTHNEEKDIKRTLDALAGLEYPDFEVIIVDDSNDCTLEVVQDFVDKFGFNLIHFNERRGVSFARNRGIEASKGEILVLLNADVILDTDFLLRIEECYDKGAQYLLVESKVINTEKIIPRFIQANHHFLYDDQYWINWTEGFSCLKKAAVDVGMFPEEIPYCGGEDAIFGEKLEKKYKKVIDRNIVVRHIAPKTFAEFWAQRVARGRSIIYRMFYFGKVEKKHITFYIIKISSIFFLKLIILIPFFLQTSRITRKSPRSLLDFLPFCFINFLDWYSHIIGQWQAIIGINRKA
jgi:glycosyltransferase involved in cell wall biosynthesis